MAPLLVRAWVIGGTALAPLDAPGSTVRVTATLPVLPGHGGRRGVPCGAGEFLFTVPLAALVRLLGWAPGGVPFCDALGAWGRLWPHPWRPLFVPDAAPHAWRFLPLLF